PGPHPVGRGHGFRSVYRTAGWRRDAGPRGNGAGGSHRRAGGGSAGLGGFAGRARGTRRGRLARRRLGLRRRLSPSGGKPPRRAGRGRATRRQHRPSQPRSRFTRSNRWLATSILGMVGSSSICPDAWMIVTRFVSASKPPSGAVTSLATILAKRFAASFLRA